MVAVFITEFAWLSVLNCYHSDGITPLLFSPPKYLLPPSVAIALTIHLFSFPTLSYTYTAETLLLQKKHSTLFPSLHCEVLKWLHLSKFPISENNSYKREQWHS